jgi:uncharacterized UBP type Zn finger protein
MHRFSPHSTRAIKGRKNGVKKNKITRHNKEQLLINNLLELGYSYERATNCLVYIENTDINSALNFFELIETTLL